METKLVNWSKSARSACFVYKVKDVEGIATALASARAQHLTVIPHGAGHSYTDAALNTGGIVIDVTPMRRILSWDPSQGIMEVEPGVTLLDMAQVAYKDGWWLFVSPSAVEITIGGCAAMNVNGRNAWQCGPFGAHILSLDVVLATGEQITILQERDAQFFRAFVGSLGLLGVITSIRVQLRRIASGYVNVRKRSAASLAEILSMFAEEQSKSDFMEAWIDGFASGTQLGRGTITCATLACSSDTNSAPFPKLNMPNQIERSLADLAARLGRPVLKRGIQLANRAYYWRDKRNNETAEQQTLFAYTYWPPAELAAYHTLFPQGVETFQAFVPKEHAQEIFTQVLQYSQQQECMPVWCVIKQHRSDPFLLSYQVDGFSLELNYQRSARQTGKLEQVLRRMTAIVIEAGGRFYLAKDHFMTNGQYRQSIGDTAVESFLRLKQHYDPETLLQSDLFRRLFQTPPS